MKIDDKDLLFSKNITYQELKNALDLEDKDFLIHAFEDRINSFYLEPARRLNDNKDWFAGGSLCVIVIDLLARLYYHSTKRNENRCRIELWLGEHLGFDENLAKLFYENIRNGLVHEGRLTEGGQFSNIIPDTASHDNGIIVVNPGRLHGKIFEVLGEYLNKLRTNDIEFEYFKDQLDSDCKEDLNSI